MIILAMSARGGKNHRRAAGARGFLVQPVNVAALVGFLDSQTTAPR